MTSTTTTTRRRLLGVLTVLLLVMVSMQPVLAHHRDGHGGGGGDDPPANPADGSCIGNFEIDGNLAPSDIADCPDDWATVNETQLNDLFNSQDDDAFVQGSKNDEPGAWECDTQKVPGKVDLVGGGVLFRQVGGEQFLYFRAERLRPQGDAHYDIELNQLVAPHPNCPGLPLRTEGDKVITFDTDLGGKEIRVRLFTWVGDSTSGAFVEISDDQNFQRGVHWDGAVNIPNTIPGKEAGVFGEAAINLTASPLGEIGCTTFAGVSMKSRASESINAALKDFIQAERFVGPCPISELSKSVRNPAQGDEFDTTATAVPGDEIDYRITYRNLGQVAATNVTVTDVVRARSTFVACTAGCTLDDPGGGPGTTITWQLGTVEANGTRVVTYRTVLDETFPAGSTAITNVALVETDEEEGVRESNETTVTVTAAPQFRVEKVAHDDTVAVGDTTTYEIRVFNDGNAPGTTNVVDTYDRDHVTVSNVSDGGIVDAEAGTVTWTAIAVAPGPDPRVLTYTAEFKGPFLGDSGADPCDPGEFPVVNTVAVTGDSDSAVVCVEADPEFRVTKTASDTSVDLGDVITYSVRIENVGDATGTTAAVDDYDQDAITIVPGSIAGGGVDDGDRITWTGVTLNPNEMVTFTYQAEFTGLPSSGGTAECPEGRFPVVNTVTVTGHEDSEVVCLRAEPAFVVSKSAEPGTVEVGGSALYTVTVRNEGDGPGATDVVDHYDADHVEVSDVSHGGVDDPEAGTITWTGIQLDPGDDIQLTYTATFVGPFAGRPGEHPDCPGAYAVLNRVEVEGDEASHVQCVIARGDLEVEKSTDTELARVGDLVTYTLTFRNVGPGTATDVVLEDTHSADAQFVECSDGCVQVSDTQVRWNLGDLAPGEEGTVTVTFRVLPNLGCVLCDVATVAGGNSSPDEFQLCIDAQPAPRPDLANASGNAFGLFVHIGVPLLPDIVVPPTPAVASSQSGIGSDHDEDAVLNQVLPAGLGSVGLLQTSSTSTVSGTPMAAATNTSVAQVADVNLLGVITADVVRSVAHTTASGAHAGFSSAGTTFTNLRVMGAEIVDVAPNTIIPLPVLGNGAYVALREEVGSTTRPAPGQLSSGTYAADLSVNAIRVHVPNLLAVGRVDITVAHAQAHSDFPQTELCEAVANQSVSGHAFVASATTDPALVEATVAFASIPPSGGDQHVNLLEAQLPDDGSILTTGEVVASSSGTLSDTASTATSSAEAADVCLLEQNGACVVAATVIRTSSTSTATAAARGSSGETEIVGLSVAGTPIPIPSSPDPNTEIPLGPLGFIVLNEQFCDFGASLANGCRVDDLGHAGLTVRALRVVLLPELGPGGGDVIEVIVAESHSDATFR